MKKEPISFRPPVPTVDEAYEKVPKTSILNAIESMMRVTQEKHTPASTVVKHQDFDRVPSYKNRYGL